MSLEVVHRLADEAAAVMVRLSRGQKRALLVLNDFLIMLLAVWLAMSLRLSTLYVPPTASLALMLLLAPVIGIGAIGWFGPYRLVTRFIGGRGTLRIAGAVGFSIVLWALAIFLSGISYQNEVIPRSIIPLYGLLAFSGIVASRQIAAWLLRGTHHRFAGGENHERRRVVIWGAGQAGVNLLDALRHGNDYEPVGFIDENESLWGQDIAGLKVYRPLKLAKLVERDGVKEVLLAVPQQRRRERRDIIRQLSAYPLRVKTLPDAEDVVSGRVEVSDLRPLDVQDLLGREAVPPDPQIVGRDIRGRCVMVTGAGGSIGSELVRQIIRQAPRKLILLDISESALYEIGIEVSELLAKGSGTGRPARSTAEVVLVLGSVTDEALLAREMRLHQVETIYHAAAYKHVPIVEHNPVMGLTNNTFGTLALAEMAQRFGVGRVVLISTDKAVRPTNVMGASKRLAELIFQAATETASGTVFTMVRFGNVLDSSGSVVRRFRKQIEAGGPVTVTHRDIVRYFMSIPEAASLVLQAGAMAKGGEVFVLDMGEPVKIDELARSMIRLMGLEVQDDSNPDGDIAIRYIGLRPGEKLYEELWLDDDTTGTEHPRIMRKAEPALPRETLMAELEILRTAMATGNIEAIRAVLVRTVEGYRPSAPVAGRAVVEEPPPLSRTLH